MVQPGTYVTNDINEAIAEEDTCLQRNDTTWVNIANISAMQLEQYSTHATTYIDSSAVEDYLSYFFVSAHTPSPWLYFNSPIASGYSVDNSALGSPQNVLIEIVGSNINISWDTVIKANSYIVHSSDDPYSGFAIDTSGSFTGESWNTSVSNMKKFYRIIASTEVGKSECFEDAVKKK